MAGMLSHLVKAGSQLPITLLHADRDEASFPLRTQVLVDVEALPNASAHVWFEREGDVELRYDGVHGGTMDLEDVVLPEDALFYLCGPVPFMRAVRQQLLDRGVSPRDVQYEVFGPDLWQADAEEGTGDAPNPAARRPAGTTPSRPRSARDRDRSGAVRRSRCARGADRPGRCAGEGPHNGPVPEPTDAPDPLTGWTGAPFTAAGQTHDVRTRGSGPGVVLLPEIPGITPEVLGLGDHLVAAGFTVAIPSLFGQPGRPVSAGYALPTFARACITREFQAFARGADRPVAEYVRALARDLHQRAGGPGVGVIGMCFTGGFALASAVDPAVLAPVASQPSLPLPLGAARRRDLGMSDREATAIRERISTDGLCLLGLRFSEDAMAPGDRFAALEQAFGAGWRAIRIDSAPGNAAGIGKREHSVLTSADVNTPGHPTHEARAEVTAFLRDRLMPTA